jgi:hypothetical protein
MVNDVRKVLLEAARMSAASVSGTSQRVIVATIMIRWVGRHTWPPLISAPRSDPVASAPPAPSIPSKAQALH